MHLNHTHLQAFQNNHGVLLQQTKQSTLAQLASRFQWPRCCCNRTGVWPSPAVRPIQLKKNDIKKANYSRPTPRLFLYSLAASFSPKRGRLIKSTAVNGGRQHLRLFCAQVSKLSSIIQDKRRQFDLVPRCIGPIDRLLITCYRTWYCCLLRLSIHLTGGSDSPQSTGRLQRKRTA